MKTWLMICLIFMIPLAGNAVALEGGGQSIKDDTRPAMVTGENRDHDGAVADPDRDKLIAEHLEMLKMMDMLEHFDLIRDMETIEGEDEQ